MTTSVLHAGVCDKLCISLFTCTKGGLRPQNVMFRVLCSVIGMTPLTGTEDTGKGNKISDYYPRVGSNSVEGGSVQTGSMKASIPLRMFFYRMLSMVPL